MDFTLEESLVAPERQLETYTDPAYRPATGKTT